MTTLRTRRSIRPYPRMTLLSARDGMSPEDIHRHNAALAERFRSGHAVAATAPSPVTPDDIRPTQSEPTGLPSHATRALSEAKSGAETRRLQTELERLDREIDRLIDAVDRRIRELATHEKQQEINEQTPPSIVRFPVSNPIHGLDLLQRLTRERAIKQAEESRDYLQAKLEAAMEARYKIVGKLRDLRGSR